VLFITRLTSQEAVWIITLSLTVYSSKKISLNANNVKRSTGWPLTLDRVCSVQN